MNGLLADVVDPPLVPGSPEWQKEITASKCSAILGLNPWTSRFACYYELAGMLPRDGMTSNQARGHWLEPAIANWFADEHGLHLRPGLCWRSRVHPWMVASPDRLAFPHRRARTPQAVVEIKTAADYDEWGPDGTDVVPPHYRAQLIFQLDTLGLPVGYLAVLLPRLSFRSYTIRYDAEEAEWIREEVLTFVDTLPGGPNEKAPDIDADDSTYTAVRRMHPDIVDLDVEIDEELARDFVEGVRAARVAKRIDQEVKARMAQAMGTAKRAVLVRGDNVPPVVIATRQVKGAGMPYVSPSRSYADYDGDAE